MSFVGKVESDFLKISKLPDSAKSDLINFAATDFETLRTELIRYIRASYPLDYQNFSESDLGMMLIELVAYMGAVMSMKADMLANENFISTAKNRNNVKKLLELLGIKLKGPISAGANAKLTLSQSAATSSTEIPISARSVTIQSPEDGGQISYTLYKVVNGQIEDLNSTGAITLYESESDSETNQVWSNLVLLEGSLVAEEGYVVDNTISKTIRLSEAPVIERSVNVFIQSNYVNTSGAWTYSDNLFYESPTSRKFEIGYSNNYNANVVFGDGVNGALLPTNSQYLITYRVGGGSRGNLKSEVINYGINTTNSGDGVIENTSVATGGQDAESIDKAKKYAPLIFKTQNRLVTAQDYAVFAGSFISSVGTAGKAKAVVRDAFSSANVIDIYLLQVASDVQLQQATVQFKKELLTAIEEKKMLTDEIVIVDGVIRTLDLVVTVRVDQSTLLNEEKVKANVRNIILDYFNVNSFDFEKPFIRTDLVRQILRNSEIRFATVDNFDSDVYVDFNEIIQLNNFTVNVVGI